MRSNVDYLWIILAVIVVILLFTWRPIVGMFTNVSDSVTDKEGYEAGREAFYNADLWGGPGSNRSCAMCHAPDFTEDPANPVEMDDYKPGEPVVLTEIRKKYGGGVMDTGDELFERIMMCVSSPSKMGLGRVSRSAPFMDDLMTYVMRQ